MVQYKNLNSLGRAYRAGNVDRSTYIKQRRRIIDDFTHAVDDGEEDITIIGSKTDFDEATTIVSTATELAERDRADENTTKVASDFISNYSRNTILLALVTLAGIAFFYFYH